MFSRLCARLLPLLRIPPNPAPPSGAPGSARVFHAARNFYRLRLLTWGLGQVATAVGILVSLFFLAQLKNDIERYKDEQRPAATSPAAAGSSREVTPPPPKNSVIGHHGLPPPSALPPELQVHARRLARQTPWWLFPALTLFEFGSVLLYLLQLPVTYALVRLEYEQRWYIVTDRSLRIRSGLVSLQETTMSFANLQQVAVNQGPLQRLLGIADVQVRSAGGGGGGEHKQEHADSMHVGIFHGVDNAVEIRDLILERLRRFRAAGLGDPDDHREAVTSSPATGTPNVLAAAREALDEAKALRRVCEARARSLG